MKNNNYKFYIFALLTIITASITFGYKYWLPEYLFWDENYHIASAYKYLNGVFFLEPHPPLGKLILYLSEAFFELNSDLNTNKFLVVDHIKDLPKEFSFKALRLPGVIFAILTSFNLFLIFYKITESSPISFCISTLFSLDNAILVHSRSAMLEAPQLFLISLAILIFTYLIQNFNWKRWSLFCLVFGLAISIKLNSAILLILVFFIPRKNFLEDIKKLSSLIIIALVVLISTYYIHFRISNKIKKKTYGISKEFKQNLKKDLISSSNLTNFKLFLVENYKFIHRYQAGVPKLKPDNTEENGSHAIFWPAGKKSISYRWDKTADGKVKHLKLQINPVGWLISFCSILFATMTIFSKYIFKIQIDDKKNFTIMSAAVFSYLSYMLVMSNIPRVMYLYHYFIPLIFTFIISSCIIKLFIKMDKQTSSAVCILLLAQVICFYHFSPFTYHLPVSADEFNNMSWLGIWRNEQIFWQ